jgi:hypothetical protein
MISTESDPLIKTLNITVDGVFEEKEPALVVTLRLGEAFKNVGVFAEDEALVLEGALDLRPAVHIVGDVRLGEHEA